MRVEIDTPQTMTVPIVPRAAAPAPVAPPSEEEARIAERYAAAFEAYDMDALASLLREDAILNMPPFTLWLRGREAVTAWMLGRGAGCRGSKLVRVDANGSPAYAQYKPDGTPWSLFVLEIEGGRVATQTFFLDCANLYPFFDLPMISPR